MTDDVNAYEAMKIRILNAGHRGIANPDELLSIKTIAGCMANPLIRALFRKLELDEFVPHVTAVPGMTPEAYVDLIDHRFSNPEIVDTTSRVSFDGSSRHPGFLHPIIREGLTNATPVVDATGVPAVAGGMTNYIANGGAGLFFGVCPADARIEVSPFELFRGQITLAGSHSLNHNIPEDLGYLNAQRDDFARIVSRKMTLEEMKSVFDEDSVAGSLKIQFVR